MAAPLRYPLILLAWGAMAAIYLPLLPADGALPGDGALAMKDNSVQTCVTAKKSAPGEWRIRPPLFTVGHFDETCFSIDRTRPAHGACCFHYLRR
nr:hypothetical protein [Klebsiella pneumoniae]